LLGGHLDSWHFRHRAPRDNAIGCAIMMGKPPRILKTLGVKGRGRTIPRCGPVGAVRKEGAAGLSSLCEAAFWQR